MSAWIYVEDGMPKNGVSVLVTLVTRWGRRMSTVAAYYGEKELESCDDGRTDDAYDEETDKWWSPPGWYEEPCSAEEVYPLDGVAVAWMPLEVAPEKPTAEEPREVVDECGLLDPAVCRDCGAAVAPPLRCPQCGSSSWREPREVVEPAPAPVQCWRCVRCGCTYPAGHRECDSPSAPGAGSIGACGGPVVPVTDAQPAGADGEAGS